MLLRFRLRQNSGGFAFGETSRAQRGAKPFGPLREAKCKTSRRATKAERSRPFPTTVGAASCSLPLRGKLALRAIFAPRKRLA